MTGALKRLTSTAFPAVLAIVAIWTVCLVVLVPLHPGASQANKVHQFGTFSSYAFDLIIQLQKEMSLAVDAASTNDPGKYASSLTATVQNTKSARHKIVKTWGRFDSSPFGKPFQNHVEAAFGRLDMLSQVQTPGQLSSSEIVKVIKSYMAVIDDFLLLETYLDQIRISDETTHELRNEFSNALKLTRAIQDDFQAGMDVITGKTTTKAELAEWRSIIERRNMLLKRFVAGTHSDVSGSELYTANLGNILEGEDISQQLLASAEQGRRSGNPDFAGWFFIYETRLNFLVSRANGLRSQMTMKAQNNAEHVNAVFALTAILVVLLTLLVLVWNNHRDPGTLFLILFTSFNVPFIIWGLSTGGEFLTDEGGVLETAQAAILLGSFALFCLDAIRFDQPSRTAAVILACVCLFMFYREVDFRTYGAPDWVIGLISGPDRRVIYFTAAAVVLLYAMRNFRNLLQLVPNGLTFRAWPFYIWPILLILGQVVEEVTHKTRKDDLHGYWVSGQLWEEMLEFDAYIVLAYAAIVFGSIVRIRSMDNNAKASAGANANHPPRIS